MHTCKYDPLGLADGELHLPSGVLVKKRSGVERDIDLPQLKSRGLAAWRQPTEGYG